MLAIFILIIIFVLIYLCRRDWPYGNSSDTGSSYRSYSFKDDFDDYDDYDDYDSFDEDCRTSAAGSFFRELLKSEISQKNGGREKNSSSFSGLKDYVSENDYYCPECEADLWDEDCEHGEEWL